MEDAANRPSTTDRRITWALLSVLNLSVGLYVFVYVLHPFFRRLTFPGVLEHQESMTIFLLHRTSESLGNLYQMPSLQAECVIYNPTYYFYIWVLHPLLGYQSAPIRLVSVVPPLLLCLTLIEVIGRKYIHVRLLSWSWAFLSLAVYPRVTWIDLARPEAMLLMSIILIWFTLCIDDTWRPKFILVGLAIAFSFSIKQPGALYAAAPLALAFTDRRYLISVAVAVGTTLLFAGGMYAWFGEPYLYWIITQPSSHPFHFNDAAYCFWHIFTMTPIIVVGPLLWLSRGTNFKSSESKFLIVAGVTFVISTLGAGKLGGWFYQYAILLFLATIPAADIIRRALRSPDPLNAIQSVAVFVAIFYSVVMLGRNSELQLIRPGQTDRLRQAALLETVKSIPGETWVTTWPHIDLWAGHPVHASIMFLGHYPSATEETERAIRTKRFSFILTSVENPTQFDALISEHYLYCGSMPMRHFGARMFLPSEVWARSPEERELVIAAMARALEAAK